MRAKPIITTLFGLAIAAGSVFLAKDHLLSEADHANATPASDIVEIYVARSEIAFGQAIEGHLVTLHKWPREALPVGAFYDIASLVPADREQQRRAKGRFFPGEVMLASKVSEFGEKVTLVQKLGENTRAMAIKVDAVTAVGGFVTPGDFVDIVLTQGAQLELRAVTILQNIRVIGVDQQSEELNDQPEVARTITVEVTPEQGQRLALAQKAGTLSLTLRTLEGVEDKPMEMVRLRDLLQEEGPVEKVEVQPTVRVRRGTESEIVTIIRNPVEPKPILEPEIVLDPAKTVEPTQSIQLPVRDDAEKAAPVQLNPRIRPISLTQILGQ
ncbi:Flp pilus assembly protein CpaB [Roseovarius sp. B08]|uniref:Flp pilus assembly protein CpaB n=1 Tax=Roseovarius sp. B08 TaxID=3449223 RepID=UPI003EDBDD29